MKLDSLSSTRLNTFFTCGMKFYFSYVMGLKIPPSAAMMLGSQFHESVGYNFEQKIKSHEDLPVDDVLEHFAAGYDIAKQEVAWQPDEDPGKIKDTGISIVSEYHKVASPQIQPAHVEKEFEFQTKEYEFPFTGRIDCISDVDEILEMKTTSNTPRHPDFKHILQASFYAMAFRFHGVKETHVRMDYAIKTKTPRVKTFLYHVSYQDLLLLVDMIEKMKSTVGKEIWLPNRGSNLCNRRWCGYWDLCEQECHGRVPD